VTGSLRLRHAVWIALAALVGVVVGYLVITDLGRGSDADPVRTSQLDASATSTANGSGGSASQRVLVPDVLGQRLPAAEARLNDVGLRNYRELDATDQNRVIVEKDNWIVASQEPAAGETVPANHVIVLRVRKSTDDFSPVPAAHGVVPNVVCAELQAAQDALRGSGFYVLTSTDGTGQGRIPVMDRNWVVIAQSVKAGESPGLTTHITLTVVKHGEPAGSSGCQT
jgi:PASTA domain